MALTKLKPLGKKTSTPPSATTKSKLASTPKTASKVNGEDADSPLRRKIRVGDLPKKKPVDTLEEDMVIGKTTITLTQKKDKYTITIPLFYPADEAESRRKKFTARIFADKEWLDPEGFDPETLEGKDAQRYNMFHNKIYGDGRTGLISVFYGDEDEAGILDLLENLEGQVIHVVAGPGMDVSQHDLKRFQKIEE